MALVMSDLMNPGATALQVILRPAYSLATVFVSPITPACNNYATGVGQKVEIAAS